MNTGQPQISVVVPTCHRNDLLAVCLRSLAPGAQTLPADRYEVIVTDDGSRSTAEEMVRTQFPWARWTAGPRRGPAANRNHGASLARGDWLVFIDDDCIADPRWLEVLASESAKPVAALEGAIHPVGNPNRDGCECPVNLDGGHFWSANIAVAAAAFRAIGGFDEGFTYAAHEDQDLQIRLQAIGPIAFVPAAIVRHPVRRITLRDHWRRLPRKAEAWRHFAAKHCPERLARTRWQAIRGGVAFNTRLIARNLWPPRPRNCAMAALNIAYSLADGRLGSEPR